MNDSASADPFPATVAPGTQLPPVAPDVVAAAVEGLTSRLRKKLDEAIGLYAATPVTADGGTIRVSRGEDAVVTLSPGPSGAVTDPDEARCSCLLAPRCLHRAAVLGACPIADADMLSAPADDSDVGTSGDISTGASNQVASGDNAAGSNAPGFDVVGPTAAQVTAASALWAAAAAVLAAGIPAAGAVLQAELLRAAHSARLAGLYRAEGATLRVVRGLRAARARHDGHRLADLVSALRELLLVAVRVAAADPDPALIGTARRNYEPGGSLRVYGVCREPVISATGYGGVVTHVVTEDGRWLSVADVKPGGSSRARGAATATVALGAAALNHAQLARGGLLVSGATVSPDGRLGAGKGVRANPVAGLAWSEGALASLFARPVAEAVNARLSGQDWSDSAGAERHTELIGCDLVIVGAVGDRLLARELRPAASPSVSSSGVSSGASSSMSDGEGSSGEVAGQDAEPDGPLIRLAPVSSHPDLAHLANLRQLASRPGLRVRVIGRLDPDRAATLLPLAVGPVPGAGPTLLLPKEWLGRADLGYDRLQGAHLPPLDACPPWRAAGAEVTTDPVADAPLWRVRRLVELAVAGGRRAVAESARSGDSLAQGAPLRRSGFEVAAGLAAALTSEADRRGRDVFGRLADSGPDGYASAWLATAAHLAATERALVQASWSHEEVPQ